MKRLLLSLLAIMAVSFTGTYAQDLSDNQLKLRTQISKFLKSQGYSPEIDPDGDIMFRADGYHHWVVISRVDDDPMFVSLLRLAPYIPDFDPEQAFRASRELNLYKTAKLEIYDEGAGIKSQMYLKSWEAFADVFYKMMEVIDNVYTDFVYEYENAE